MARETALLGVRKLIQELEAAVVKEDLERVQLLIRRAAVGSKTTSRLSTMGDFELPPVGAHTRKGDLKSWPARLSRLVAAFVVAAEHAAIRGRLTVFELDVNGEPHYVIAMRTPQSEADDREPH